MKRLLQLLLLVTLSQAAQAQEDFYNDYLITISGGAYYGGDLSSGCGSQVDIYLEYQNGDVQRIFSSGHGGGMVNFSEDIVFRSDNKIKGIRTYGRAFRQGNITQSCNDRRVPGEGYDQIALDTTSSYPCLDQTFRGKFRSYDATNSTIRVEIYPFSTKSLKMVLNSVLFNGANQGLSFGACSNTYHYSNAGINKTNYSYALSATMNDGSSETFVSGYQPNFAAGSSITSSAQKLYPVPKRPLSFRLTTSGNAYVYYFYYSQQVCQIGTTVTTDNSFGVNNPNSTPGAAFNFLLYSDARSSNISFTIQPYSSLSIKYAGSDNILPYDTANRVTIYGPSGNPPSFYHWLYSTDGSVWADLPDKFQGKQRLSISGYDIMGEAFINYHSKNLFFKLVIDCTGGESSILTVSGRISAPNIVSITPLPDRCYDKPGDGAFKIKFSRPLLSNGVETEALNILLTDPANPQVTIKQYLNVALDVDNSFECVRELASDQSYLIQLQGVYLSSATYVDNPVTHTGLLELVRPQPVTSIVSPEAVHCYNGGDGKIVITGAGGVGNYGFEWVKPGGETLQGSFGASVTAVIDLLKPGTYTVRIRDGNNCGDMRGTRSAMVTQPLSPLQIAYTATTDPRAYGYTDGQIETIVAGGTPYPDKHYTVAWYDPAALLPETAQSNAVLSEGYQANVVGLGDGSYILKTYDSQYELAHPDHRAGCYAESEVLRLIQPAALVATISQYHEVKCYGNSDGALSVTAQGGVQIGGGVAPYLYIWFKEENGSLTSIDRYDNVAVSLTAGVYRVKIIDDNSIEKLSDAFILTEPDTLIGTVVTTPVSCDSGTDGTAQISAQGGTAPYTYEWSVPGAEPLITGLPAATYYGVVTDVKGCVAPASGTVQSPDLVTSEITSDPAHCHGGGDGKIRLVARGGSGRYHFSYGRAGAMDVNGVAFADGSAHVIDFISEGTYQVEVRDDNNCVDMVPVRTIYVAQPAPLEIELLTITNPRGYGYTDGSIEAVVSGGTAFADGRYTAQWYDPVNLLPESLYAGKRLTDGYHARLVNVGDGSFYLQAYDSAYAWAHPDHRAGCTIKSNTFRVIQPPPLVVDLREHHFVSCYGFDNGEVEARAGGGVKLETGLPYKYEWFKVEGAGITPVAQTDSIARRLRSGTYRVKITDRNSVEKISEPFFLVQPDVLQGQVVTTPVSCGSGLDGTAFADVQGGTLPYRYAWSSQSSEALVTQLVEGRYFVAVADSRGCKTSASGRVTSPFALKVDSLVADPQCFGYANGSIDLDVKEGSAPYRYVWNNGQTSADIDGLPAGVYSVVIFDSNNCRNFRTYELKDPEPVRIELGKERYLCNDQAYEADASLPDTGTQYQWTGPGGFTAASAKVSLTQEGTYQVQATDSHGCMGEDELTLKRIGIDIGAEFVVSTQAFANTEVTLLNLSTPVPDSSQWWVADRNDISITRQQDSKVTLVFPSEGVYNLYLKAYRQGCEAIFSKTVTVLGASFEKEEQTEASFIETFIASPNPTQDAFTVTVSLQEEASIRLRLISLVNNVVVHDRREQGSDQYVLPYTVNLAAGIYLLMLESPKGSSVVKLVVY